jgi:putative ABC transport system permease protein
MDDASRLVSERLTAATGQRPDPDLVEELAAHLVELYEAGLAEGLSPADARARALARLPMPPGLAERLVASRRARLPRRASGAAGGAFAGPPAWLVEEPPHGGTKGASMVWSNLVRDSRYALRMLVHSPVFTAVAVATFALGIGVNAAVFSVVSGVLLRPLPYPEADRITMIWLDNRREGIREDITSYPNYRDWRDQNTSYARLAAFTRTSFSLSGAGEPERLRGAQATASFFDVMGVTPSLGRLFTDAHETPGSDAVVLISHGLWQRRFGGSADVLGRTVTLNGRAHEVIGVMPPELRVPSEAELWKPLAPPEAVRESRGSFWLPVIGRLRPGVTVEQAQADMSGIAARIEAADATMRGFGANVVPLHRQIVGDIERPLFVLQAAVAFVLLIACANLANLLLGRTAARRKELAIRTALGARRGRLVRQIVTETFVLALIGCTLGVLLAYWATDFFVALGGDSIPRREVIGIDGPVLAFSFGLAALCALVAGLIPALQASRHVMVEHLREGGRQGTGAAGRRTRSLLVASEVALAFVLLAGAGVLVRTLWTMQRVDRGFAPQRIATMTLSLPASTHPGPPEVRAFYARLLERVRTLPGVESAALATDVLQPLVTNSGIFSIEGRPLPPPEQRVEYPYEVVSPGFFETLGIRLQSGRTFTDQDHADAPRAVIINETLARLGWPGQDPLGRRMRSGGDDSQSPWMTVVGVIRDVRRAAVSRAIRPELYLSSLQVTPRTQMLVVRTAGAPAAIVPSVRREVQALDPQLPLFGVGTLEEALAGTLIQNRFQALLLSGFATIALLLAAVGIYGVTSHAVGQRTHEMGIRMALGAGALEVRRLILAQHLAPVAMGIGAGIAGALALSRSLRSLVYGVSVVDPLTFGAMTAALLAVAVLACWIPARRATRIDPLVALRAD